ncbi:MAG: V-type ATP synthase subunit B [Candidatus Bathyarchaeota archaeon]|uniref:V-type ATP synthase subunit B n=1 Tax=Candidatus Bathycorpusculum sp. TaxID=2994959 RepID=UPI0028248B8A|nr:V-type ATP synthase subunit B [Candidatus Termiticorpusculum sp.]MCL2292070.1 V-type ATP synthase subunit B [Candidatus Termiticorpusculum sp.]
MTPSVTTTSNLEYKGAASISGPIIVVENVQNVGYDELAYIKTQNGEIRLGKVIQIMPKAVAVQVFEGTNGLSSTEIYTRFLCRPLEIPVSTDMLGRVMNSFGEPIDGYPCFFVDEKRDINGYPLNPISREYPREFIQTGISGIDCLTSLVRGQKLPVFSGPGLSHNELAAQIVRQAKIRTGDDFNIIFIAMGLKNDEAAFFKKSFEETGTIKNVAMFLNLADDPPVERIITPRAGLTLAEYLAYEQDRHVLVVMTDMTNYCEALREVSSSMEEVPSRKGYPGYMYSDLASIYERAGRIHGKKGSITQMPILTMPNDDITHPIPDLTGYITEGQVVLSRALEKQGIYPPINITTSLSRLMKDGIGKGSTREDHDNVSSQLYAAYAQYNAAKSLVTIIGEEGLGNRDKDYLHFGEYFEQHLIKQEHTENRSIEETLQIAWDALSLLATEELTAIKPEYIEKYYNKKSNPTGN